MAGDAAPVQRKSGVRQRQMQRVAHQVLNEKGVPRYPQSFTRKSHDLFWFQMMQKKEQPTASKLLSAEGSVMASPHTAACEPFRWMGERSRITGSDRFHLWPANVWCVWLHHP